MHLPWKCDEKNKSVWNEQWKKISYVKSLALHEISIKICISMNP